MEQDEQVLIEAAQRDPSRFAELYESHFDRVYAFIARRVPDRSQVEDLTSEVFHRALASLGRFEWRGVPFAAWLFRIAANAIADHTQRLSRENAGRTDPDEVGLEDPDLGEIEERARLSRLVQALPQDQRRVISLRFAQQKSIREIAEELGRTEGAVKQLQFRALEKLRARMGDHHA